MTMNTEANQNLYNIATWGAGYFTINPQGKISISKKPDEKGVELEAIVNEAGRAGLQLPLLIRFIDVLHDRVIKLNEAFIEAIKENEYGGSYRLVCPIKVNQEYTVVRSLLETPIHPVGLEAGSKPELMAVIGLLAGKSSTIVCNGYKDSSYIRTALIAQQMGHEVFLVIEKRNELDLILNESKRLRIKPKMGIRIRPMTQGAGKWENSCGVKSKFGLNAEQVLDVVNQLKANDSLNCLQLMHCHLGSQIANIHDIRQCMQEVARYYIELRRLQVPIRTLNVGGGLGIDYEGTGSSTGCSINYSLKEYATHLILAIKPLCLEANMPEPNLISESGRAITAHHAVLITNIVDIEQIKPSQTLPAVEADDSYVIHDIWDSYQSILSHKASEIYHYASHSLDEAHALFKHGVISLQEKAKVEQIFIAICFAIQQRLDETNSADLELLNHINERMAAKILCNLSFFQSLPDSWSIGQIFPVAPISQLEVKPTMHAVLHDLTCDSDGTLKQYTGQDCLNYTLLLPPYDSQHPYAIAFFLVGAYQEILGNLHNLFGDTNSLDVKLIGDDQFEINDLVSGDTVTNVLNYAHYDTKKLLLSYEKQLLNTDLANEDIQDYLNEIRSIFSQLTYLANKKGR